MLNSLVGNREIKETIKNIVQSGRFPHAFIMEGEKGSGRHTLAKILAAAAICQSDNAPCKNCRECDLIEKDSHCDVLTYKPDGATFKVDTVREIRENAFITPVEAKRKVNILLDCDKMNESAQNAFLKVLEEPPSFMVFILICQNASALLTTVRSRCVTLTVQNPEPKEAEDYIKLKTGKSERDIVEALSDSHGNIGKALDILSGTAAEGLKFAKEVFGAIINRDRLAALKSIHSVEKDRLEFMSFIVEFRLLMQREAVKCAQNESRLKMSAVAKILKTAEDTEMLLTRHVGQPLSISLTATTLCAQIFADM